MMNIINQGITGDEILSEDLRLLFLFSALLRLLNFQLVVSKDYITQPSWKEVEAP